MELYLEIGSLAILVIFIGALTVRACRVSSTDIRRVDIRFILFGLCLVGTRIFALLEDWWHPQVTALLARVLMLLAALALLAAIDAVSKKETL
jgi:CHASE2 domain-containing sensor protein